LKDINKYEAAAELLENVGLIEEAVHFYLNGNLFERATFERHQSSRRND
jgi:sulfur carrier protein ThiS